MESYLNELDVYNDNVPVKDNKIINQCCSNMDNHSICEEKVLCRLCGSSIENISYLPEKCYDNKMSSYNSFVYNHFFHWCIYIECRDFHCLGLLHSIVDL